jgi:hypothetical protein
METPWWPRWGTGHAFEKGEALAVSSTSPPGAVADRPGEPVRYTHEMKRLAVDVRLEPATSAAVFTKADAQSQPVGGGRLRDIPARIRRASTNGAGL